MLWRRLPHALFVFGLGSTIRPNTNSLFGPLFGAEANTKRIFGTAQAIIHGCICMSVCCVHACMTLYVGLCVSLSLIDRASFLGISVVGQSNKAGDGGIYVGSIMKGSVVFVFSFNNNNNNNNNNNRICIAQVCRMTSEVLDGQLQSCYAARARPKCLTEEKCF